MSGYQVVRAPEEVTIPAKSQAFIEPEAKCPAGKVLTGGGATTDALGLLFYNGPAEDAGGAPNAWLAVYAFANGEETSMTVRVAAYAYCISAS